MTHLTYDNNMKDFYPTFVPISTWIGWQEIEWKNDIYSKVLSISMVSGKPLEEVRDLPFDKLGQLYVDSIEKLNESFGSVFAVKYKGQELYFSAPHLATIGEVADIEAMLSSDKPYEILKVLMRPVKYDKTGIEWTKVTEDISVKYITNFEDNYARYECKKYDINKVKKSVLGDIGFWEEFPASIYSSIVDFIAGVGISSLIHLQDYSRELSKEGMQSLMEKLQLAGVGFRRWSVWQRVTFSESQETNESQTSTLGSV